jgi:CRISPR/Cas system-associated exonuclease Cas4 (RecB family)
MSVKIQMLKPQQAMKLTPDPELLESIYSSYRSESRHRDNGTIVEKGDLKQKNLWVTDGKRCPREVWYKFHRPEKARPYTVKGLILFADGKLVHKDLQLRLEMIRKADHPGGYLRDPELDVSGYYDDLIILGHENGWTLCDILEIKTKFPSDMEPDQDDYDQDQYYLWMANFSDWLREHRIKIIGGRLAYKDRSLMSDDVYRCWRIERDDDRIAEIRNYFRKLKKVVEGRKTPLRPFERDSTDCTYCKMSEFCWKGIPRPTAPIFKPDETAEKPEQELVDSAAGNYLRLKDEERAVKEALDRARDIIMRYLRATGLSSIPVNGQEIIREQARRTELNDEYLLETLGDKWLLIASPNMKRIQAAIKDGQIDAGILEQAKIVSFEERLRIKKMKGEKNAEGV